MQVLLLCSNYSEFGVKHLIIGLKPLFVKGVRSQKKVPHDPIERKDAMCPCQAPLYLSHIISNYHQLHRVMDTASLLLSKSHASFDLANCNIKIFQEGISRKYRSQLTQGEIMQTTTLLSPKVT